MASAMDLPLSQRGVLVSTVRPGTPAEEAGLVGSDVTAEVDGAQMLIGGDVITAINQYPVNDFEDLVAYLARYTTVGDEVTLDLVRDGKETSVNLTLAARPSTESEIASQQRGQVDLGVQGMDLTPEIAEAAGFKVSQTGVLVQQVQRNSPADKAGIRGSFKPVEVNGEEVLVGGDVIIALEKDSIENLADLQSLLSLHQSGDTVELTVLRDGEQLVLDVEL
jgi:2-alkenal reductase